MLSGIAVADPPERWTRLGFAVDAQGCLALGGVAVQLGASGRGITGWSLGPVDGLPVCDPLPEPAPVAHPNGALRLDHVVVLTPDFDRTAAAFAAAGLEYRRVAGEAGRRQGFRRLGPAILEVVEVPELSPGPARFWGLVPVVEDLDALHALLGPELLGEPHAAVQPGRRIATVRRAAGLSLAMAFITPER